MLKVFWGPSRINFSKYQKLTKGRFFEMIIPATLCLLIKLICLLINLVLPYLYLLLKMFIIIHTDMDKYGCCSAVNPLDQAQPLIINTMQCYMSFIPAR